jgi:hypothetical protein
VLQRKIDKLDYQMLKSQNSKEIKDEAFNVMVNNLEEILFYQNNEAKFNEKERHRIKDL